VTCHQVRLLALQEHIPALPQCTLCIFFVIRHLWNSVHVALCLSKANDDMRTTELACTPQVAAHRRPLAPWFLCL
jgi:hypothetical protein